MPQPDADKITVNVKGVLDASWARAKAAAAKSGETLGQWISRAADQLAAREQGERIIPRSEPANPPPSAPGGAVDLPALAAVLHAMGTAGVPVQARVGRKVNRILNDRLATALPPPPARRVPGPRALPAPIAAGD